MHDRPFVGPGVNGILEAAWKAGATDLLLTVGRPPQMRVHGDLVSAPSTRALTEVETDGLLAELLSEMQRAALDAKKEFDFSVTWRNLARVRGNAFIQQGMILVTGPTGSGKSTTLAAMVDRGMVTFEQSLSALVRSGVIDYDDAVARSLYPKEVGRTGLAVVR